LASGGSPKRELAFRSQKSNLPAMTDFVTAADGTDIAYECVGEGPYVVLIHGFGANRTITWANTNWYLNLARAGRRVIAIDCRGHGESQKPHIPAAYDEERMAADIIAVMAELRVAEADIMGYSMGAALAIRLMHDAPGRVRRCALSGIGETYFRPVPDQIEAIAAGLEAEHPAAIADPVAREFRSFCEKAGDDLLAMAACMRRKRRIFTPDELREATMPVLVVAGAQDEVAGSPEALAAAFPKGRALTIPRRNHHSTVGDRTFKETVREFLAG
jgi:pimeloyl-ACP methyl ester carboxylesterase